MSIYGYNSNGSASSSAGSQVVRDSLKNRLEAEYRAQEASRKQGSSKIEAETSNALRQAYISREQQKLALPQQVALLGAGGVSESASLALALGYDQNRSAIKSKQIDRLSELNSQVDNNKARMQSEYYKQTTDLEKKVMEMEEKRRLEGMKLKY